MCDTVAVPRCMRSRGPVSPLFLTGVTRTFSFPFGGLACIGHNRSRLTPYRQSELSGGRSASQCRRHEVSSRAQASRSHRSSSGSKLKGLFKLTATRRGGLGRWVREGSSRCRPGHRAGSDTVPGLQQRREVAQGEVLVHA